EPFFFFFFFFFLILALEFPSKSIPDPKDLVWMSQGQQVGKKYPTLIYAGHTWFEFQTIFCPKIKNVRSVIRWCHQ
ncbi:unnamed protein product, partial [Staurois parvus]